MLLCALVLALWQSHNCSGAIYSSTPSDAHMRQYTRSSLVQILVWRQAIIWTNADLLSIGPLGTNFSEILMGI